MYRRLLLLIISSSILTGCGIFFNPPHNEQRLKSNPDPTLSPNSTQKDFKSNRQVETQDQMQKKMIQGGVQNRPQQFGPP